MTSTNPIKDFMASYAFDRYSQIAQLAERACRDIFQKKTIPAIISSRAKDSQSLLNKLKDRNETRKAGPYKNVTEIKADLVDLVGIRIALYIPDQLPEALKLLGGLETLGGPLQQSRGNPRPGEDPEECPFVLENSEDKKIHGGNEGYKATDLRVKLNTKYGAFEGTNTGDLIVEIQVQTVVMHAWAQIGHDLEYKKLHGALDKEEVDGLAELNAHMRTAETVINGIHAATQKRLKRIAKDGPLPKYRFYEDHEVEETEPVKKK